LWKQRAVLQLEKIPVKCIFFYLSKRGYASYGCKLAIKGFIGAQK
jgi:hypothetical protein